MERLPRAILTLYRPEQEHEGAENREDDAHELHTASDGAIGCAEDLLAREHVRVVMRAHRCTPAGAAAAVVSDRGAPGAALGRAKGTGRVGAVTECAGTAGPFSPGCP